MCVLLCFFLPQVSAREDLFLGWTPLCREVKRIAVSFVSGRAREVSSLASEDVGRLSVGSERRLSLACQDSGTSEQTNDGATSHGLLVLVLSRGSSLVVAVVAGSSHGNASACASLS